MPVKVLWTNPVTKQYFILFILLLLLFIAAIHYPSDSSSHGVHWYVGKWVVKCRGMFQARHFHSLWREILSHWKWEKGKDKTQACFMSGCNDSRKKNICFHTDCLSLTRSITKCNKWLSKAWSDPHQSGWVWFHAYQMFYGSEWAVSEQILNCSYLNSHTSALMTMVCMQHLHC